MDIDLTINPMAKRLAEYKRPKPKDALRVPRPRNAAKRCYELADRFVAGNKRAQLVHGLVLASIEHAWAEIDDLVYDGTCRGFFDREGYYQVANAMPVRRFSQIEAANFTLSTGTWEACPELRRAHIAFVKDGVLLRNPD